MKKLISILIILLLTPVAMAQEVTQDNVGTLPDSPMYGFKIAMEKINLALTFNKATKAEKRLLQAQRRLQEVQIMVEQNKLEAAEKAQKNHAKLLEKIQELEITDPEKAAKLQEKLEAHEQKLEQVKVKIQERIKTKQENKEQLEEMIGKMVEESSLAREQAIQSITKNIEKLEAANKSGNAVQALNRVKEKLESKQLLGETCITVSPDSVNECCIKKGYEKWDSEKNKCTGEKVREKTQAKIRVKPEKEESGELTITNVENKVTEGTAQEEAKSKK